MTFIKVNGKVRKNIRKANFHFFIIQNLSAQTISGIRITLSYVFYQASCLLAGTCPDLLIYRESMPEPFFSCICF